MTVANTRRGFLRTLGIATGAVLVGIGRTETAFAQTQACGFCRGKCTEYQKNNKCSLTLD